MSADISSWVTDTADCKCCSELVAWVSGGGKHVVATIHDRDLWEQYLGYRRATEKLPDTTMQLDELYDVASDFFDGTEEDRGHEQEWQDLSAALKAYRARRDAEKENTK
jgi:hypothetical protein